MTKRIELSDRIKKLIRESVEDDIDYNNIVVYEASAASTRPITQKGSPYDGAVLSYSFLQEMANTLPEDLVTLQVMHEDHFLPVGRIFAAEVYPADQGHHELNVLFYLDKSSEYVSQIDLAIISEVSIGALPEHAYCSECDFDFRTSYYAMAYGECENGHEIGVDGCHLRLTKLEKWKEVSLVNRGASDKPKILNSAKQRLGKEEVQRLAASGSPADTLYLFASSAKTSKPNSEEPTMNVNEHLLELSQKNGRLESEKSTLEAANLTLKDDLKNRDETITTLNARVQELENDGTVKELETQLSSSTSALEKATAAFRPQYELACTAAGIEKVEDANLDTMIQVVEDAGIKLAAVPRGQQTETGEEEAKFSDFDPHSNDAYITP